MQDERLVGTTAFAPLPQREELKLGRRLSHSRIRPLDGSIPRRHQAQWPRRTRMVALAAAAGMPDLKDRLMKGDSFAGRQYRAHPDGYNMLDYLSGKTKESPRKEFWYVNDDGEIFQSEQDRGAAQTRELTLKGKGRRLTRRWPLHR